MRAVGDNEWLSEQLTNDHQLMGHTEIWISSIFLHITICLLLIFFNKLKKCKNSFFHGWAILTHGIGWIWLTVYWSPLLTHSFDKQISLLPFLFGVLYWCEVFPSEWMSSMEPWDTHTTTKIDWVLFCYRHFSAKCAFEDWRKGGKTRNNCISFWKCALRKSLLFSYFKAPPHPQENIPKFLIMEFVF